MTIRRIRIRIKRPIHIGGPLQQVLDAIERKFVYPAGAAVKTKPKPSPAPPNG